MADKESVVNCALCKSCGKNVDINGSKCVKCVKCVSVFHASCSQRAKTRQVSSSEKNLVVCCEKVRPVLVSEDHSRDQGLNNMQDSLGISEGLSCNQSGGFLEVDLLKCIIEQKDIIIEELREKIFLLQDKIDLMKKLEDLQKTGVYQKVKFPKNCGDNISDSNRHGMAGKNVNINSAATAARGISTESKVNSGGVIQDNDQRNSNAVLLEKTQKKIMNDVINLESEKVGINRSAPEESSQQKPEGNAASEGWTQVTARRNRRSRAGIMGTGQPRPGVKTIPKKSFIFVSRFAPDTAAEDVKGIVSALCPEVECEPMKSKHPQHYASFKIGVNVDNFVRVMDPGVWPAGTYIDRFFRPRGRGDAD